MNRDVKVRVIKSPIIPLVLSEKGGQHEPPAEIAGSQIVYSVQLSDGRWVTRPSDY